MIIGQPILFFPSIQLSLLTLTVTHLIIVLVGLVFQIIGYITNYWLRVKEQFPQQMSYSVDTLKPGITPGLEFSQLECGEKIVGAGNTWHKRNQDNLMRRKPKMDFEEVSTIFLQKHISQEY